MTLFKDRRGISKKPNQIITKVDYGWFSPPGQEKEQVLSFLCCRWDRG
jgi:hypothetical protein